jgi:hypothetical protein
MAGIYRTFKIQQDSYLIQDQVTVMQQNLRGAMYLITRDLLMAGYLSVLDTHPHTVNWDGKGATASKRPIIIARDNVHIQGDDIKDDTDTIVIAKASDEGRSLKAGESAAGEEVSLTSMDVDLNTEGKKYGILVKQDYSKADFFEVKGIAGSKITVTSGLSKHTIRGSHIQSRPDCLQNRRKESYPPASGKQGEYNGYQVVAENIENMQVAINSAMARGRMIRRHGAFDQGGEVFSWEEPKSPREAIGRLKPTPLPTALLPILTMPTGGRSFQPS